MADPQTQIKWNRWPWILSGVLVVIVTWLWIRCYLGPVQTTAVYIVRHAEKADTSSNPPLSVSGQERAAKLAHVLRNEGIDAIYVTQFTRTQQTGAIVAVEQGLTPVQYQASDTQSLVSTILASHSGGRVLVVGHSNTVDDIAAELGAPGLSDLAENQFDRLFVVHRFAGSAHLDRLRYGAETP